VFIILVCSIDNCLSLDELSVPFFINLCIYIFLYLSIHLFVGAFSFSGNQSLLYHYITLFVYHFISLNLTLPRILSVCMFMYTTLDVFFYLCVCIFVCQFIKSFVRQSIIFYLYLCISLLVSHLSVFLLLNTSVYMFI